MFKHFTFLKNILLIYFFYLIINLIYNKFKPMFFTICYIEYLLYNKYNPLIIICFFINYVTRLRKRLREMFNFKNTFYIRYI